MEKTLTRTALIVSIGLNIFQVVSDESQEWYALVNKAKPEIAEGQIEQGVAYGILKEENKITARSSIK